MASDRSAADVLLARLIDEFAERYRRGERPSVQEYADRYPDLADDIRDLFPAMAEIEEAKEERRAAEAPALPPLRQLGDYRILREVGRGGMGVVYEAEQVSLGRHVALKVLPAQMGQDARQRRRFEREARAAAKLHHTNIVPVFGVGEDDGVSYYVMQFIQGLGLDGVIDELRRLRAVGQVSNLPHKDLTAADVAQSLLAGRFRPPSDKTEEGSSERPAPPPPADTPGPPFAATGRLSAGSSLSAASVSLPGQGGGERPAQARRLTYWQSVASIGVQVAEALEYAHKQGVLHRDVKPSNLLLDTHGTVWVTDFGLAKADDQANLTQTGDLLGTLRYMPPEAFEGRADARGDVYALGLTLYELLAFQPAFDDSDRNRLIKQVTTQEPARLGRRNPEVPRDLETVVHKAIDRDPARRYATAAELAADLERFVRDEPIRARRVSLPERLARWARHHKGVAAALSAIALLLALVTVASSLAAVRFRTLAGERELARSAADDERQKAVQAHQAERWARYRANIAAAASALQLHNIDPTRRSLEEAPEEYHNWEWRHLYNQLDGSRSVLRGHEGAVSAVAISPDGKRLASGSADGTARLWDTATGELIAVLDGHGGVRQVAFSPDGKWLASGAEDVRLWDAASGAARGTLDTAKEQVAALAWSADGRHLAAGGPAGRLYVFDAATGRQVAVLRCSPTNPALAFRPDGRHVAANVPPGDVYVWETETGREVAVLRGRTAEVLSVAYSPDGRRIATGSIYPDNRVRLWDATGREIAVGQGHTNRIKCVAFSPDGKTLASSSFDQTVRLWDGLTGEPLAALRGHSNFVKELAFSPDGRHLVSASTDQTLRLWDVAKKQLISVLRGHGGDVVGVAYSRDGTLIASACEDATVRLWDAELAARNGVLDGHTSYVYDVAFSPDGKQVASAAWDGTVRLWDPTTGRQTGLLRYEDEGAQILSALAYSPDGKQLAVVVREYGVSLWDVASGKAAHTWRVSTGYWKADTRPAWDPRGKLLAAGSVEGPVRLWDAATRQEVATLSGHQGCSSDVAFRPDGAQIATGGEDGTVRLWDAATREPVAVLRGHSAKVNRIAYSADGRLLASGSGDRTVRLWDTDAAREVGVLQLGSAVYGVAWSPDGTRLACACADNTIRLWDLATRKEVCELRGHEKYVHAVAFSPDGTRLASASGDFTVRIWDALPLHERTRLAPAR
jgi:WD40 repeat protein/serine/threonine protein kinase